MPSEIEKLIEELEAGLEGVTPGPWKATGDGTVESGGMAICTMSSSDDFPCITEDENKSEQEARDELDCELERAKAHIARCSPDNIRKLLDYITSLRTRPSVSEEVVSGDAQAIADRLRRFFDTPGAARRLALDAAMMIEYLNKPRATIPNSGGVGVKELDLSNLLKHAFLSGVVAARAIPPGDECDGPALWPDYDPDGCSAFARIRSALTNGGQT